MFSMCSELTPRARIPDTRIPQLMQPCGGEGGVGGRGNGLQEVGEAAASIPGLPVCPVTNSCPYPSVPGSFSQREVLASSYKLVHLFNSMLVQFGSEDSIVCPICPKIESQTRIIGKLLILIKCPENCQHIILPQNHHSATQLILSKIPPPWKHVGVKTNTACSFLGLDLSMFETHSRI